MAPTLYDPASLPLRVIGSVLRALGLIVTGWRIHFRLKIHRFWWEDAWAAVVMFSCLASLVGEWMYLLTYNLSFIVGFWLYSLGYISVVNTVYLSILFSIIRILPETRLRKFTCLYAACCGVFWIVSLVGKIWWCASNSSWQDAGVYQPPGCLVSSAIAIFEFTTDCLTVGILIAIPLHALWRVKLQKRQRRMILSVFASSIMLAFVAVFHVVGDILNIDILVVAGSEFQIACSIIVCNLLVVVTYAYRFFWRDGESSDTTTTSEIDTDDFTQPSRPFGGSPATLTTVEINSCVTSHETSQTFTQSCTVLTVNC